MKNQSLLFVTLFSIVTAIRAMEVTVIDMKDNNQRENVIEMIKTMYDVEGCGVCKQQGADVFWFSPHSRCAHQGCFDLIKPALIDVYSRLEKMPNSERNTTHIKVVRFVQAKIGDITIKSYCEKNGLNALRQLFREALGALGEK